MTNNLGVIEGTVTSAKIGSFVVSDYLFGNPVICYGGEHPGFEIGQTVTVTGIIERDDETGKPLTVNEISDISIVEKSSGAFKRACGLIPWKEGDEPAEVTIRRIRDMSLDAGAGMGGGGRVFAS